MTSSLADFAATFCLVIAVVHTFLVGSFRRLAEKFPEGSVAENSFHLLGEVEVVFGLWAAVFLAFFAAVHDVSAAIHYLESRNFTEPAFVFVIMTVCSTRPILNFAARAIERVAGLLPLSPPVAFYLVALTLGPTFGSFMTEPAAMTVTALILLDRFYSKGMSRKFMYATLGLLFVNISIGGTLTPYAAPPVLMVASVWQWDLSFMITHFGWKGALASLISTVLVAFRFRKELAGLNWAQRLETAGSLPVPFWVTCVHLVFLVAIVLSAHHMAVFVGLFLFFLGLVTVTREYQSELNLKAGLLVAFFLGGLVILGGLQRWWVEPLLTRLGSAELFLGATALTAVIDNAALTFLGSQVPDLSEQAKYLLVSGAVVGGGLTIIANAPNPAGYGILNPAFGDLGISPLGLFVSALVPTAVAGACFYFL